MAQSRIPLIFLAILSLFCSGVAEDTYQSPDFFKSLFGEESGSDEDDGKLIVIENQEKTQEQSILEYHLRYLAADIAGLALKVEDDPVSQSKILALAWEIGPQSVRPTIAFYDLNLRAGKDLQEVVEEYEGGFGRATTPRVSELALDALIDRVREKFELVKESDPRKTAVMAPYLGEVLRSFKSENLTTVDTISSIFPDDTPQEWANIASVEVETDDDEKEGSVSDDAIAAMTAGKGEFKRRQSLIKGLLVAPLDGSDYAGEASQMTATVMNASSDKDPTKIIFNQDVGESMMGALEKVQKYHSVRNDGIPRGKQVHISFEEQYSSKDGPSAAVACSLLLESLIKDHELDPNFAVTGDMNSDGSVQPVGGIDGKIRGATKRNCSHVAIPTKNTRVLKDMIVAADYSPLINIQVFSITTFDDALSLASAESDRSEQLQLAMSEFREIQGVLQKPNGEAYLKNAHVLEKLRSVLKAAPNHESARLLLMAGEGRAPSKLSLTGSLNQIDRVTKPILVVMKTGNIENSVDDLMTSIFALRRIRNRLDPRTKSCSDALEDLSEKLKTLGDSKLSSAGGKYSILVNDVNQSWAKVRAEYKRIEDDPAIQEELN